MNDRDNPYPPYDGGAYGNDQAAQADQYEIVGYDEYGRPVYQQRPAPGQAQQQGYAQGPPGYGQDPYGSNTPHPADQDPYGQAPYATDPYGSGPYGSPQTPQAPPQTPAPPPQQAPQAAGYDPYGRPYAAEPAESGTRVEEQPWIPQQAPARGDVPPQAPPAAPASDPYRELGSPAGAATGRIPAVKGEGADEDARDYRTEMFSFIEEPTDQSEDVIDWLKFTESRTERREEARRRGRSRVIALVVAVVLVVAGGVGYLWYAGELPGTTASGGGAAAASGPQKRDVIVVHLHNTKGSGTSTMLLVDNTTTKRGTAVLLPNSLALTDEDGNATTLGKSVEDDGSSGTSEALDGLLGTDIQGTWRLDTPYLNNLVELVGTVDVDTDTNVPDPAKKNADALVHKGQAQSLSGAMAVAYATYRAPGEPESAQLKRFGDVMRAVLRKVSSDPKSATVTVQSLAQILDPSLTDKDLGSFLAKLAELAKGGDYTSTVLPAQKDGTLSEANTDKVVKDVLGGAVKSGEQGTDDGVRVGVKNATGDKSASQQARVTLLNGGYSFVDGSSASTAGTSRVLYTDTKGKKEAVEVARTLGLPDSVVKKGEVASNADVSVVLGSDYKGEKD